MTNANHQAQTRAVTQPDKEVLATGTLVYGVPYQGRRHYNFAMRLPTMGDNIDALETHPDASVARIDLAMFAACMQRLGDIPEDDITFELLATMVPTDLDVIYAEMSEAKKSCCCRTSPANLPKTHPRPRKTRHLRGPRP
ncbi:hypothetical protein LMG1866_03790 [Achromobacter ruhlandii]|nr:hypothetical protein [Achromobacter ruhlandii]CAB3720809.1 hypothetical protein LMG1866_03790 [Achromobacter ruhlandii]